MGGLQYIKRSFGRVPLASQTKPCSVSQVSSRSRRRCPYLWDSKLRFMWHST